MPGLSPYVRTLNANQRVTINARGVTVFLRQATGDVKVTLRSQKPGEDGEVYSLTMSQAEQWQHASEFTQLEVEDVSGAANTIEFYIGYGVFRKPVPDIVNVQVTSAESETVVTVVDETAVNVGNAGEVQILANSADRVYATITALAGNADTIRIGDSNVDTDRGIPLAAGETLKWTSKAAAHACSEAVAGQSVAVVEFEN